MGTIYFTVLYLKKKKKKKKDFVLEKKGILRIVRSCQINIIIQFTVRLNEKKKKKKWNFASTQ